MSRKQNKSLSLFTDGGSRGNPGPSAVAGIILDGNGKWLAHIAKRIKNGTNNRAEYIALIKGLKLCRKHTNGTVRCFSDSQLMINQMNGKYAIRDLRLRKLAKRVKELTTKFELVTFAHVKRSDFLISMADQLLNEVLDNK